MSWLEEIPYVKNCFCCLPQRAGNILIGVTGVVVYLSLFAVYLFRCFSDGDFSLEVVKNWSVVYYGIETLLMLMLLLAISKKSSIILAVHLWVQLCVYMAAFALVFYFFYTDSKYALTVLIYYICSMYLWLCHTSYYQELTGSFVLHMAPSVCKA